MDIDTKLMPKFGIGTTFKPIGKHARICIVTDILRTYNNANELVKIRYVASHWFAGQQVLNHDVCETTIARGIPV